MLIRRTRPPARPPFVHRFELGDVLMHDEIGDCVLDCRANLIDGGFMYFVVDRAGVRHATEDFAGFERAVRVIHRRSVRR